jgi:hypothetical protein
MFNPQPKPEKKPKNKATIKKVSNVKKYRCSDGTIVSQVYINQMLSANVPVHPNWLIDRDHTISQKRCKELNKTELIWSLDNVVYSLRDIHKEWECYASGAFEEHTNVVERMLFVKEHDPEMFEKRFQRLSNYKVMKAIR